MRLEDVVSKVRSLENARRNKQRAKDNGAKRRARMSEDKRWLKEVSQQEGNDGRLVTAARNFLRTINGIDAADAAFDRNEAMAKFLEQDIREKLGLEG